MATDTECKGLRVLDPVQGLIDYILDVKPFHTKIVEVLVEYVYEEMVDLTVLENLGFEIEVIRPGVLDFSVQCQGGYSLVPYGGPRGWPVISPNQRIAFHDYPAINDATDTITVPGDRSQDLLPGDPFELISFVEDTRGVCRVVDPGTGSVSFPINAADNTPPFPQKDFFKVMGDHTAIFLAGLPVIVTGFTGPASGNNGTYTIFASSYDGSDTKIEVNQPITSSSLIGAPMIEIDNTLTNVFVIEETSIHGFLFTSLFSVTDTAFTLGYPLDDGKPFTITGIFPGVPSAGLVRVEVAEMIREQTLPPSGYFGMSRLPGDHTGLFTVETISYTDGTNTVWDGVTNLMGDDPNTKIQTVEDLDPIPSLVTSIDNPEQVSYSVIMRLPPLEISKVVSYSNFANLPTNTPDEGYISRDIVGYVLSTLDGFGVAIPDTGKIILPGNITGSNLFIDEWIRVLDSSENNGLYIITSIVYDNIEDETIIGVKERIRSDTVDGIARIDIPGNMFYMDGDHTHRFRQGVEFKISGGSYQGHYMTLYSDFVNGRTRVRPSQEIINIGKGAPITDILDVNNIVIGRDKTIRFHAGSNVNIVGSTFNDGMYEISTSVYDPIGDLTTITLVEELDTITPVNGELFLSDLGFLKESFFGYSEGTDFCEYNPEARIHVRFDEELTIEGITLNLHNHLIAYNMENDDWWGIDTPIHTHYAATAPVIPEQATAPVGPGLNDFWFNTDEGLLYYWSVNNVWIQSPTVYWLNTDTNLFFYRTMYDRQLYDYDTKTLGSKVRVDTDWVQMFANPPGYADVQPASSNPVFNAHVTTWSNDPHRKVHDNVSTTPSHFDQSYTIYGGNFVHRMGPELRLEFYDYDNFIGPFIDFDYPQSFDILSINIGAAEIEIDGIYDWFFEVGTILGVRIWNDTYHEMEIVDVRTSGGDTHIEVSAADINRFQGLTTTFGTVFGAVYDPRPNWTFPNDQVKTYVLPKGGLPYTDADSIAYSIVDPQRIHTLTTDATIKENFSVDWGSVYAWRIKDTNSGGGQISVDSDISDFLSKTDTLFITQSQGNDGEYEISSYVVNVSGPGPLETETVITLNPAPPTDPNPDHRGFVQIEDSEVVDWFQFILINANATTNVFTVMGDATNDIPNGGDFRVVGTLNDGTYTASAAPVYSGGLDQTTIQVANIPNNDTGGWIEHV